MIHNQYMMPQFNYSIDHFASLVIMFNRCTWHDGLNIVLICFLPGIYLLVTCISQPMFFAVRPAHLASKQSTLADGLPLALDQKPSFYHSFFDPLSYLQRAMIKSISEVASCNMTSCHNSSHVISGSAFREKHAVFDTALLEQRTLRLCWKAEVCEFGMDTAS